MKGTLFSTDFVFDANGNPRLIELNTDTGAVTKTFGVNLHMDGFINELSSSNITEVHFLYKPFQENMVDWMEEQLNISASFITKVSHTQESEENSVPFICYPIVYYKYIVFLFYIFVSLYFNQKRSNPKYPNVLSMVSNPPTANPNFQSPLTIQPLNIVIDVAIILQIIVLANVVL